ncbi:hypothetical protein SP15_212 [Bacillus phage SP-15]|uniref:Uncharacterized protein n=1 Tax=Bacillus phage SP-15 TaxID=1792032 RepID=A0A127AWP7_9CAUD|nr:hypothetical protein SP15_212 [Bacillus phage SP-15]AMM45012.1 hypothetical protein SP15_212 [Bacillus phage SP-15]
MGDLGIFNQIGKDGQLTRGTDYIDNTQVVSTPEEPKLFTNFLGFNTEVFKVGKAVEIVHYPKYTEDEDDNKVENVSGTYLIYHINPAVITLIGMEGQTISIEAERFTHIQPEVYIRLLK